MAVGGRGMPQKDEGGVLKVPDAEHSKGSRREPDMFTAANKTRKARRWKEGNTDKSDREVQWGLRAGVLAAE